jgi:hypothetical protein
VSPSVCRELVVPVVGCGWTVAAPAVVPACPGYGRSLWPVSGWFEVEDELDEIQDAFVTVLRERAVIWPLEPDYADVLLPHYVAYGYVLEPGQTSHGRLLVVIDVPDPVRRNILLTVGAYFAEDRVTGDKLHNQLYTLPDEPTPLAFEEVGNPEALSSRTADWFEAILRRPIVRYEWLRLGKVYAHRYLFADTSQGLVEGTVRTGRLGTPDRVITVR